MTGTSSISASSRKASLRSSRLRAGLRGRRGGGGWELDDTVAFAKELQLRGVDVIDCSSGGIGGSVTASASVPRGLGFQMPFAERIRREAGIAPMASG
jgi:2,4-dienoyl-CoA reductase-like NADH-dependent reductase (Old Yellow Enzyme family)